MNFVIFLLFFSMITTKLHATMCSDIPIPDPKELIEKAKKETLKTEINLLLHNGSLNEKTKIIKSSLTAFEFEGSDLKLKNPINLETRVQLRSDLIPVGSDVRIISHEPIKTKVRIGNEPAISHENKDFNSLITLEFPKFGKSTITLKEFFNLIQIRNVSGIECSSRNWASPPDKKGENILSLIKDRSISKSSPLIYLYCMPGKDSIGDNGLSKLKRAISAFDWKNEISIGDSKTAFNLQDETNTQTCYPLSFNSRSSFITAMYYFPLTIGGE